MRYSKRSENMFKTIYCSIEDDVTTIAARLKTEPVSDFILVFPKRSYVFSDPLNLKMLKKQLEILKKQARIMTMDERGQQAAAAAGFILEPVPVRQPRGTAGDMIVRSRAADRAEFLQQAQPVPVVEPVSEREDVAAPAPEAAQPVPRTKPIPRVTVHDTIFSETPRRASAEVEHIRDRAQSGKRRRFVLAGVLAVVLLIGTAGAVLALPRAQVVLVPKSEAVQRDMEIALSVETKSADATSLALPAQYLDVVRPTEQKFEATGKKEVGTVARGTVRIFNITGSSINLRAATTTLQANGKSFTFSKDQLYIRSVTRSGLSNPNAGVVAEVVAATAGESGNLPVGTKLEISNQVFGNKPDVLYAVVEEGFSGGTSRFVTTVEEADLVRARAALVGSVVDTIGLDLKAKGQLLAESAYTSEISNFSADKPAGTESPTFTAKASVRVRGLAFEPLSLTELVRRRVAQVLPQSGRLQEPSKDRMSFQVKRLDVVGGTMALVVHLETRMFQVLNLNNLAADLRGKTSSAGESALLQKQPIASVRFEIWPKWYKKLPFLESRIGFSEVEE